MAQKMYKCLPLDAGTFTEIIMMIEAVLLSVR